MAKQYTKCIAPQDHSPMNQYIQMIIQAILAGAVAFTLELAKKKLDCWPIALEIFAVTGLMAYCRWWLGDRLLCLGGDVSAAGMLISTERPEDKTIDDQWDTDTSINLLIPPGKPGAKQAELELKTPFGHLIKETQSIIDLGLPWTGMEATDVATGVTSASLHAEFEGGGVADVLKGAKIAFGLAVAALAFCVYVPWPWAGTVATFLALLALLILAIAAGWGHEDKGSESDAGLPSLTHNDTSGQGADILGVFGTWVYDSGHNNQNRGWNEIHPIKAAAKLGSWTGAWTGADKKAIEDWVTQIAQTNNPLTIASQQQPEHTWQVHPYIDGCFPPTPPPPASSPPVIK
jgi:hypothetical protein